MRVIVCGGRDFTDQAFINSILDAFHRDHKIQAIAQGGARGADLCAKHWARDRQIIDITFHANWQQHGKAAGPIRNQEMLDSFQPHYVIAFPGGRGTADMINRSIAAQVKVYQI